MGAIAYAVIRILLIVWLLGQTAWCRAQEWCKPRRVFGKFSRVRGNVGLRRRHACIAAVAY